MGEVTSTQVIVVHLKYLGMALTKYQCGYIEGIILEA